MSKSVISRLKLLVDSSEVSSARSAVGALGGAFAAFKVGQFLGDAIKQSIEFETAVAEVGTLMGRTAKEMGDFTTAGQLMALQYGGQSKAQMEAFYQAVSAGFGTLDQASTILDQSNKLAVAGVTDTETALDGLTSALNAYGQGSDQAERFSDVLFTTVKLGKTTVEEYAGSLGRVAPLAAQVGVSFEELSAATAVVTSQGISTSETMSALKQVFANILKPSADAAAAAAEMGIQFDAAALEAKGLVPFLQEVMVATDGNAAEMGRLFGSVESLVGVLATLAQGGDAVAANMLEMAEAAGATQTAYEIMGETSGKALERAAAAMDVFKLSIVQAADEGHGFLNFITNQWAAGLTTLSAVLLDNQAALQALSGDALPKLENALIQSREQYTDLQGRIEANNEAMVEAGTQLGELVVSKGLDSAATQAASERVNELREESEFLNRMLADVKATVQETTQAYEANGGSVAVLDEKMAAAEQAAVELEAAVESLTESEAVLTEETTESAEAIDDQTEKSQTKAEKTAELMAAVDNLSTSESDLNALLVELGVNFDAVTESTDGAADATEEKTAADAEATWATKEHAGALDELDTGMKEAIDTFTLYTDKIGTLAHAINNLTGASREAGQAISGLQSLATGGAKIAAGDYLGGAADIINGIASIDQAFASTPTTATGVSLAARTPGAQAFGLASGGSAYGFNQGGPAGAENEFARSVHDIDSRLYAALQAMGLGGEGLGLHALSEASTGVEGTGVGDFLGVSKEQGEVKRSAANALDRFAEEWVEDVIPGLVQAGLITQDEVTQALLGGANEVVGLIEQAADAANESATEIDAAIKSEIEARQAAAQRIAEVMEREATLRQQATDVMAQSAQGQIEVSREFLNALRRSESASIEGLRGSLLAENGGTDNPFLSGITGFSLAGYDPANDHDGPNQLARRGAQEFDYLRAEAYQGLGGALGGQSDELYQALLGNIGGGQAVDLSIFGEIITLGEEARRIAEELEGNELSAISADIFNNPQFQRLEEIRGRLSEIDEGIITAPEAERDALVSEAERLAETVTDIAEGTQLQVDTTNAFNDSVDTLIATTGTYIEQVSTLTTEVHNLAEIVSATNQASSEALALSAEYNRRTSDALERWDGGGLPSTRPT